jgi:hypothetical protein
MRTAARWLGLAGMVAIGVGAFAPWYAGQTPRSIPVRDVVRGIAGDTTGLAGSLALPLLVAVCVGLLGTVVALRLPLWFTILVVAACIAGWVVRESQHLDPRHLGVADLRAGFWATAGGVLLAAVAAAWPRRRPRHAAGRDPA